MKIVQQLGFELLVRSSTSATYELLKDRIYFDPDQFTEIQAVYLEISTKWLNGAAEGDVQFYNITTSEVLATFHIDEATWTRHVSADLKASLTSACVIGLRMRRTVGAGINYPGTVNGSIIVCQDDPESSRKTASYFPLRSEDDGFGGAGWGADVSIRLKPRIDEFDGAVNARFEVFLKCNEGETCRAKLYDATAEEDVAGSEVSTNNTDWTRCVSGNISLDSSHEYYVMTGSDVGYLGWYMISSMVVITAQAFNKIAANCAVFARALCDVSNGLNSFGGVCLFRNSLITGPTSLSFKYDWQYYVISAGSKEGTVQLYDVTAAGAIVGTVHEYSFAGYEYGMWQDDPTLPGADNELTQQTDDYYGVAFGLGHLIALQRDDLPAGPSLPADPTQPTGYHCFMSQFIRNLFANAVPLETPDGINKWW